MAKKQPVFDDPLMGGLMALLTVQMRAADTQGRKAIYEDLATMHQAALAQGQPKTARVNYALTSWAGVQRQFLDPH